LEEGLTVNISLEKWFSPPLLSIKEAKLNQFYMKHILSASIWKQKFSCRTNL
jgi:hypothetical protein